MGTPFRSGMKACTLSASVLVCALLQLTMVLPLASQGVSGTMPAALDSARARMAAGRYWRAAQGLREVRASRPGPELETLLLLAQAEAGWGNWVEVGVLLGEPLRSGLLKDPRAWHLLGRAAEEAGRWLSADSAYGRALEASPQEKGERPSWEEARIRRARVRSRAGDVEGSLGDLEAVTASAPGLGDWLALELAKDAASAGNPRATEAALSSVRRDDIRGIGWDLVPRSLLAAGDSSAAEAGYWTALARVTPTAQALGWERVGALRLVRGDSLGARAAYHRALEADPRGAEAVEAAQRLVTLGFDSARAAMAGAEALARAGRNREAVLAYRAFGRLVEGPAPPAAALGLARVHLAAGEASAALGLLEPLMAHSDPAVAAPALVLGVGALTSLGRAAEGRELQDSVVARFPQRPEAVEVLFQRARSLEGREDRSGAVAAYRKAADVSPSQNLAGESRMREGRLLLSLGRPEEALVTFRAYLDAFPEGRRWDQAAFWAGRMLLSLGRQREGESLLHELEERFPLSYYSVEAARLLSRNYRPPVPDLGRPPSLPAFLSGGLVLVDALASAGLEEASAWEVARLTREARALSDPASREDALLGLALELDARGLTREGINLGWELRRGGRAWDVDLLAAVYPLPYRDLVLAEAGEQGLDPFLMAGLIRQESAFWARARSRADARGLMQVLPSTGSELARSIGPRGFSPDDHLFTPEINIHLGMAFFDDLRRRFGENLPILLSAYNAGPSRALRWREFPEAADPASFVERIPFDETRDYVKAVTLNRAVYAWLYGPEAPVRIHRDRAPDRSP